MKLAPTFLPDNLFDAIHFSALAFGGVGGGAYSDYRGHPLCLAGHECSVRGRATRGYNATHTIHLIHTNDRVVHDVCGKQWERIPWEKYRKAMNIHPERERGLHK